MPPLDPKGQRAETRILQLRCTSRRPDLHDRPRWPRVHGRPLMRRRWRWPCASLSLAIRSRYSHVRRSRRQAGI